MRVCGKGRRDSVWLDLPLLCEWRSTMFFAPLELSVAQSNT